MADPANDDRTFLQALVGDGRPPIVVLALGLIAAGGAALFLAATGHFLPHDERYLGMTAEDLCRLHGCRIVHFMVHDRASFGGVLIAIGLTYLWLAEFPLRERATWAWWTLAISGTIGFSSFLAYVGYGYLDAWHGVATLALLPCFLVGLVQLRRTGLLRGWPTRPKFGIGIACVMASSIGATVAGFVILGVGMSAVFVPQDLEFIGVSVAELRELNPRLVPLIAHDRAGFGGALVSAGTAVSLCAWFGRPNRARWQALALAGLAGFGPAIGVHFSIGYTDPLHLAPAIVGAGFYAIGLALMYPSRRDDGATDG